MEVSRSKLFSSMASQSTASTQVRSWHHRKGGQTPSIVFVLCASNIQQHPTTYIYWIPSTKSRSRLIYRLFRNLLDLDIQYIIYLLFNAAPQTITSDKFYVLNVDLIIPYHTFDYSERMYVAICRRFRALP